MKQSRFIILIASIVFLMGSCQKNIEHDAVSQELNSELKVANSPGSVYTLSNEAAGNRVLMFSRSSNGMLASQEAFETGGAGTGAGLGSQGAVALSDSKQWLVAVNAGSNSITSFSVSPSGLSWVSTVGSGGNMPVSVTVHNDLVYVLNAGAGNNISGFRISADGELWPLEGSIKSLSAMNAGGAQVSFANDGDVLVITEKNTNMIISYKIDSDGLPGMMHALASANATPFGFAVGKHGIIYVSEAGGGAPGASTVSSYQVNDDGTIQLIDGPNAAGQTAACWVVDVNNGKYVYATNTGSGNISSFRADNSGGLEVQEAAAGVTGIGSAPIDAALSNNSKYLYALLSGTATIAAFQVTSDGSLEWIQNTGGLPDGTTGLAAN